MHCEVSDGRLAPVAIEALGAGDRLATALGQELSAVLIGDGIGEAAREVIAYGAGTVYVVDAPSLREYATEPYLQAMETIIRQDCPGRRTPGPDAAGT